MAERQRKGSPVGAGESAPPKRPRKRVVVRAGGHVIEADPLPETPAESVQCSVCGGDPARCGHGGGGGWAVEGEG